MLLVSQIKIMVLGKPHFSLAKKLPACNSNNSRSRTWLFQISILRAKHHLVSFPMEETSLRDSLNLPPSISAKLKIKVHQRIWTRVSPAAALFKINPLDNLSKPLLALAKVSKTQAALPRDWRPVNFNSISQKRWTFRKVVEEDC